MWSIEQLYIELGPTYVKYPYIGSCDDGPQQPHVCFFSPSFGSYWEETWRPIEKGHGLILDLFHRFSIIIIKSRKNSSNANISSPLYTRTQSGDIISDFAFFFAPAVFTRILKKWQSIFLSTFQHVKINHYLNVDQ